MISQKIVSFERNQSYRGEQIVQKLFAMNVTQVIAVISQKNTMLLGAMPEKFANKWGEIGIQHAASYYIWFHNFRSCDSILKERWLYYEHFYYPQETDYMGVVFHFYNSDDEEDDDEDDNKTSRAKKLAEKQAAQECVFNSCRAESILENLKMYLHFHVFHMEGFLLPAPSEFRNYIEYRFL